MQFGRLLTVLFASLWLAACSTMPSPSAIEASLPELPSLPDLSLIESTDPDVQSVLMDQYQEWKGVRYRMGGLSKNGIDCSGFVYLTYREQFQQNLPRTTAQQSLRGNQVSTRELLPGDLIFFRTGRYQRHVGMYIGDNQFLHVSSRKGVTISALSTPYWVNRYWQARRVM
ncbi:MAG: C40 family peptidase [Hahellaceae bacterium]|nr:C40 family peptidase [Hahellaceae bacterium]